jgi:hypothetical protein
VTGEPVYARAIPSHAWMDPPLGYGIEELAPGCFIYCILPVPQAEPASSAPAPSPSEHNQ